MGCSVFSDYRKYMALTQGLTIAGCPGGILTKPQLPLQGEDASVRPAHPRRRPRKTSTTPCQGEDASEVLLLGKIQGFGLGKIRILSDNALMLSKSSQPNALINETSPYLLQHAYNPVAWHPWGKDALELAKKEEKPILLSVGYSACHWCHVMAHESFEDEATARLMNEYFVNIKVDREERPDLDKIYQTAQQLLTGRTGGWPLTMFLMPEGHVPFFGGTYFPPAPRHGLPSFKDLLARIHQVYRDEQPALLKQNTALVDKLNQTQATAPADAGLSLDTSPVRRGIAQLLHVFDRREGGFGGAPKFPHPVSLELSLNYYFHPLQPYKAEVLKNARFTLEKMAQGGIYDQIGGGFCRYSVDDQWRIPHFEKMLYDNGPLLALYANAWRISGQGIFEQTANETATWVMREMQSPEGGYFSSLDADSEGEEGKFYTWEPDEAQSLLTADEFDCFSRHFGLDRPANFEGHWHLYVAETLEDVAASTSRDRAEIKQRIQSAREKLFQAREKRIRPGRDEKILTSWNALMIKGLSVAAIRLRQPDYFLSAERCLEFIHSNLWDGERLTATYKDGKAHLNAYLDDYAFLIDAIVHLLSYKWSGKWLNFSMKLADTLLERFFDAEDGGFFFTSHDHEALLQRRKDFTDDSLPSGNGTAAAALLSLGHLTGRQDCLDAAEKTLKAGWGTLEHMPHACNAMLSALMEYADPRQMIILRGQAETITRWQRQLEQNRDIRSLVFAIPSEEQGLPDLINEKKSDQAATAFICQGFQCLEPISDPDELQQLVLRGNQGGG